MTVISTKVIRTYRGDTAPDLVFNITREAGSIVDLTGAEVAFIIQDPVTRVSTNDPNPSEGITNMCTLVNPVGGICLYSWNAGGTDTPDTGYYPANLKIRYPDGSIETYALTISVEYALIS